MSLKIKFKGLVTLIVLMVLMLTMFPAKVTNAEQIKTSNRFNVAFVLDSSGSMKDTDPEKWRFEAVSLFIGLLAESGNYVGSVVFGDDVSMKQNISEITSIDDKKNFMSELSTAEPEGWTNTGEALIAAEEMLMNNGNDELSDIIIYLADGNTEMGTEEETEESLTKKAQAIQDARDNNIKIYSVCLNAENSKKKTNPQEMEQISTATGGGFEEVNTSSDLTNVFQRFYELIYSTSSTPIGGGTFDSSGIFHETFEIPYAGVEEVNIITATANELKNIKLIKPDGTELKSDVVNDMTMHSSNYNITKVIAPEGGTWEIVAEGSPDTTIDISMIFNAALSVSSELRDPKDEYQLNDEITIQTFIKTGDKIAVDDEVLENYATVVTVENEKGETENLPLNCENGEFLSRYTIKDYGTYTFNVDSNGYGISAHAEPITIYVGNTPPVVLKESTEATGYIWPLFDLDCSVDLSGMASDKEDSDLTYSVVSSSFMDDSYEIDGNILRMKDFDISKGSFTIAATDSMGAVCEFEVYMKSRNMGLYFAIIVALIIAIILIVSAIRFYQINLRYYHAKIRIISFNDSGTEESEQQPVRGRYRLSSFGLQNTSGIPPMKSYFQASGKNTHTFFFSKKKFYARGAFGTPTNKQVKKIKISRGSEVTVSMNKEFSDGINIYFEPEDN